MLDAIDEVVEMGGKRKVSVYRRSTGTYYFMEWYFSTDPVEQGWIPLQADRVGFYDSAETALREAVTSVPWLQQADEQKEET